MGYQAVYRLRFLTSNTDDFLPSDFDTYISATKDTKTSKAAYLALSLNTANTYCASFTIALASPDISTGGSNDSQMNIIEAVRTIIQIAESMKTRTKLNICFKTIS